MSEQTLNIWLFKDSFEPFVELLKTEGIDYVSVAPQPGVIRNAAFTLEIISTSAGVIGALATVVQLFLKRPSRKIIATISDGKQQKTVHLEAEDYSSTELAEILSSTVNLAVIETKAEPPQRRKSLS